MFSKILVKLIDQAILPAILLLSVRILSVVLICKNLNIGFTIDSSGFAFSQVGDYIIVNSYSTFFMIVSIGACLGYVLFKSYVFHDSHIRPNTSARLFSLRLHSLIQPSYEIYTEGAVWISYLYLIGIISAFMAFFGLLYPWVFYVALLMIFFLTVLFVIDIEREVDISRNKKEEYDLDSAYLEEGRADA